MYLNRRIFIVCILFLSTFRLYGGQITVIGKKDKLDFDKYALNVYELPAEKLNNPDSSTIINLSQKINDSKLVMLSERLPMEAIQNIFGKSEIRMSLIKFLSNGGTLFISSQAWGFYGNSGALNSFMRKAGLPVFRSSKSIHVHPKSTAKSYKVFKGTVNPDFKGHWASSPNKDVKLKSLFSFISIDKTLYQTVAKDKKFGEAMIIEADKVFGKGRIIFSFDILRKGGQPFMHNLLTDIFGPLKKKVTKKHSREKDTPISQPYSAAKVIHMSDAVVPSAPGGMFFDYEKIMFTLNLPCTVDYTVTDVYGAVVDSGTWKAGTATLKKLPRGFYEIHLTAPDGYKVEWRSTFSIVPPRRKLKDSRNFQFAFDAAIDSATPKYRGKEQGCPNKETMIGVALRCGIYTARSRTGWRQTAGKTNIKLLKEKRDTTYSRLKKFGIDSVGMQSGPASASGQRSGRIPLREGGKLDRTSTDDLFVIYNYCRDLASVVGSDNMRYSEPFNEPDMDGGFTAWELAAASKAAFLGFRDGDPKLKVLSSSFCLRAGAFHDTFLESGMKYYIDIFNIHNYWSIPGYKEYIQLYRNAMKKYGLGDTALFVTENGETAQAMKPGPKPREKLTWSSGDRCHSLESEYAIAEWMAKTHFESIICGVDMNCIFFLWPILQKPMGDWGHFRSDSSTKPSLTVFANLAYYLAQGKWLGIYDPGKDMRGMLYAMPDGTQTLVFWKKGDWDLTGKPSHYNIDKPTPVVLPLKIADGEYKQVNMYGTPLPAAVVSGGKARTEISTIPTYLLGLKGLTPQKAAPARGKTCAAEDATVDKTIVLRLISGNNMKPDSTGAFARIEKKDCNFSLDIYNFGKKDKSGTLNFQGDVKVSGPDKVSVPAGKYVTLKYTLQPDSNIYKTKLSVSGSFEGKKVTRAVMPLVCLNDPSIFAEVPFKNAMIAKNWFPAANGRMIVSNPQPDIVSFYVPKFTNTNRWICPKYIFKPGDSVSGYIGMAFDFREFTTIHRPEKAITLVASTERGGKVPVDNGFRTAKDEKWHTYNVYFSVDEEFLKQVKEFRIGGASRTDELRWEVRNLRLLKLK